ncbi:MAG: DUF1127 domain-containing protein [Alphaproteobacteria bacterium]|nr:DUF1127 domain-containing protein [Alphaproteobacteria bacterium]
MTILPTAMSAGQGWAVPARLVPAGLDPPSPSPGLASAAPSPVTGAVTLWRGLLQRWLAAHAERRAIAALKELEPRMLADIGLSGSEIEPAVRLGRAGLASAETRWRSPL